MFKKKKPSLLLFSGFFNRFDEVADLVQVYMEHEGGVGFDAAVSIFAIGEFTGNDKFNLATSFTFYVLHLTRYLKEPHRNQSNRLVNCSFGFPIH